MSITAIGKVEQQDFGTGVWAFVTEQGETYELMNPPSELSKPQAKVKIVGNVRDDVMTIAMIGPVLEISSYKILE